MNILALLTVHQRPCKDRKLSTCSSRPQIIFIYRSKKIFLTIKSFCSTLLICPTVQSNTYFLLRFCSVYQASFHYLSSRGIYVTETRTPSQNNNLFSFESDASNFGDQYFTLDLITKLTDCYTLQSHERGPHC